MTMTQTKHTPGPRDELAKLLDAFPASSRSQKIRTELADTIVAIYCAGHITRQEYLESMAYVG